MSTSVRTPSSSDEHRVGRRTLCVALLCVLVAVVLAPTSRAQDADDLMEVFWEFRYSGVVNTVVDSRYDGERFYISLSDLFGALQINVIQEPSTDMVRGFYLQTNRQYEIDFNAGRAFLGNTEIRFDSTAFVKEPLGFFLSLDLYQRLFNLSMTLNERTLAMALSTPDEMPVVAEARRRATRVVRDQTTFMERNAPLLFDRDRSFMSGGVVGYRLSTQLTGTSPRANVNLRGGGELLGGDLEMGVTGNYSTLATGASDVNFSVDTWRWRYVLRSLPALRQAQVGELSSDGLTAFQYVGTRLSNDPVEVQRFFGSYPMRIESEPGWEVEIYVNNQLIDVQTADAAGVVTFSVPITYGSTTATVREYGPSGEYRETQRRIQVPFTFVPPGEIRYNLYAGRATTADRDFVQATTSVGITSWLTAKWGFDYVTPDSSIAGEELANLSWGSISARIGPSYILTARVAPGTLYKGSLNAFFPSLASVTLEYTQYAQNPIYNRSRQLHESRGSLTIPIRIAGLPISWRTSVSERRVNEDRYTFTAQQDLSFQPGVFRLNFGLRSNGSYTDGVFLPTTLRLEPRLGYSFARADAVPKPLRGLLFSLRSSYDLQNNSFLNLSANFSRRIGGLIRLQSDVNHQVRTNETSVSLRLALDLASIRTSTRADVRTRRESSIQQDLSGALSYDAGARRLDLSDRDWVGRSAATIRMFVDYNGNDDREEGEPYIENGDVRFQRTVSTTKGSNGFVIVYNLQAYEQYSLSVDQSSIRNPLWVPKFDEFSFISDPNVHKVIDIPFYVTGEVTGSVLRESDGELSAVPGLKLHLEEVDGNRTWEEAVFSDGSFYKLGLPPGRYQARVDSSQLAILATVSDPAVREFEIRPTEMGDMVDGVDFVLRDRTAEPGAVPAVDDRQPEEPIQDVQPEEPVEDVRPEMPVEDAQPVDQVEDRQPAEPIDQPDDTRREQPVEPEDDDQPTEATIYIVEPGLDGLKELARMVYEDESLWPKIWLANLDLIDDPSDLTSGMRLAVPPKAPLTAVERAAGAGYEQGEEVPVEQRPQDRQDDGARREDTPAPTQQQDDDAQDATAPDADTRPQDDGAQQTVHRVTPSDVSLMGLARQYYDDGFLWPKIWLANRAILPNPDRMERGMELVIPPKAPLTEEERRAAEDYAAGTIRQAPQDQQPIEEQPRSDDSGDEGGANPDDADNRGANPDAVDDGANDDTADGPTEETVGDSADAPEAAADSDDSASRTIHTVVRGDVSVMNLARQYYDDWTLWAKIWVANRDQLPVPEALEYGMRLVIPPKAPLTAEEREALEEYHRNR